MLHKKKKLVLFKICFYDVSLFSYLNNLFYNVNSDVDLESITVVAPLYTLYLREGTGEKKVQALNMRTRIKLIQHMTKFRALPWPSAMKVCLQLK